MPHILISFFAWRVVCNHKALFRVQISCFSCHSLEVEVMLKVKQCSCACQQGLKTLFVSSKPNSNIKDNNYYPELARRFSSAPERLVLLTAGAETIVCADGLTLNINMLYLAHVNSTHNDQNSSFPNLYISSQVYAVGGYDGQSRLSSVECYDSFSNRWTEVAPMKEAVSSPAVASCAGKLFVIGGGPDDDTCSDKVGNRCVPPAKPHL